MAKYDIVFMGGSTGTSDDAPLAIVNQAPSSTPPPGTVYTDYKHGGNSLVSISTTTTSASLSISAPAGVALGEQRAEVPLGTGSGVLTTLQWNVSGSAITLDVTTTEANTEVALADTGLPPQALKVKVLKS